MRMRNILFSFVILTLTTQVWAQDKKLNQKIEYDNNQTLAVDLSISDPNLIVVDNDDILNIQCAQVECVPTYDKSGSAIVQLGQKAKYKAQIMLFVETVQHHNFSLVVTPKSIIGQTIQFIPLSGSGSEEATKFENKTPYQEMLVDIVNGMVQFQDTGESFKGFNIHRFPQDKKIKKEIDKSGLTMFPIHIFAGNQFVGMQYGLQNNTNKVKGINAETFYRHGVVAGAVSNERIKPGQIANLYLVLKK